MDPVNSKIGIIGLGVVGQAMSILLKEKGYNVYGVSSRNYENANNIARRIDCTAYLEAGMLVKDCDIIFVTVPDSVIGDISYLLANQDIVRPGQYIVHMSGALTSEVLQPFKEKGVFILSMHPLQSFANLEEALVNLPQSYFSLEGDSEALEIGKVIVRGLEGIHVIIKKEDKPLYHAAACLASNFLVTLVNVSVKVLAKTNFSEEDGLKALLPLIKGTINNIENLGPVRALTGPIARGDTETITNHLQALEDNRELASLYKHLGLFTTSIAEEKGTSLEALNTIRKLLLVGVENE